MRHTSRREFLAHVGTGMVAASIGTGLATDIGFNQAFAADGPTELRFGDLEPLVVLMQETPANRLLPLLTERLRNGTELRQLMAAGVLANARTFGGEDYIGFHTMMAMSPAFQMASEMPMDQRALPVLKVLYRNTNRIQERGGRQNEVLRPVQPGTIPNGQNGAELLRTQVRDHNTEQAERTFAALASGTAQDAFDSLLWTVEDGTEVHRTVLPYRAFDLLRIVGQEQAHTMLRQSVRYCLRSETPNYVTSVGRVRQLLPQHLERLEGRTLGTRQADDAWVEQFSMTLFRASPEAAMEAVAGALTEGMAPDAIGEAFCLAANQLVLRDQGRPQNQSAPNRPPGSVHGDGIGVHACDTANAWRNMARLANHRNRIACLLLGGYQLAQDRAQRGGDFLNWQPYPTAEHREPVRENEPQPLLRQLEDAIRNRDQPLACAVAHRYGERGHAHRPIFDLLLRYAVSEDGALHAEKYYRTATEEFGNSRPAFRWRQVISLARVTASAYGQPAPGVEEATRLLRG